jgi:serine phosphatase RsbU (regulator of sigma subunit)
MIAANLWAIFVKRQNRLIAATMMLVPAASLLTSLFIKWVNSFAGVNLFSIANLTTTAGLSVALGLRAWKEWRARDALQAEFEAAREVQQLLVTPAVDVPGFHVESAYLPATRVGGDFFYIRSENPGALLVVVGDVSGKGLRAALTVSAIMGALRTMPSLPPKRILGDLNRGLVGQMRGGFVTCCAMRIEPDGTLTLANAGHLAPYRNAEEMNVSAGLPLSVDAGIQYGECQLSLGRAEALTFVSDGVIEARKPTGELFGFERAREISRLSAAEIAAAAQSFGQEDDITVVQLRRVT